MNCFVLPDDVVNGRRLESEHLYLQDAEDCDLSGFLFIREENDRSDGSCWNLKWCELGKKELKAVRDQPVQQTLLIWACS